MLSRRWPNATRLCENDPPASGPRGCIAAAIAGTALPAALPSKVISPQMPHMSSDPEALPHARRVRYPPPPITLGGGSSSCTASTRRLKALPQRTRFWIEPNRFSE
jgi:hypothetical protein